MSAKRSRKAKKMKRNQTIAIVAIIGLLALAGLWFVRSTMIVPAEIDVQEAHEKYRDGVYFLDVRTPEEWQEKHLPGAYFIPLEELQYRLAELPADQEIVIVCRSGNRSMQAREFLKKAGFTQVSSVAGGLNAWGQAGYELEAGN